MAIPTSWFKGFEPRAGRALSCFGLLAIVLIGWA
jgi:hypothetical protein